LFRLDPTDAALNANASRSQVGVRAQPVRTGEGPITRASRNSRACSYVSRSELDKARMNLQTAQEALRAAEANNGVVANQASYTTLRSTVAGVVTSSKPSPARSSPPGQVVARIAKTVSAS
jgi:multidrug resistance efflux pump